MDKQELLQKTAQPAIRSGHTILDNGWKALAAPCLRWWRQRTSSSARTGARNMQREWLMMSTDPYTRQERHQLASIALLIGALALLAFFASFNPRNDLTDKILLLMLVCLLFLLTIPAIFIGTLRLKRLATVREDILHGGPALLAGEQPVLDADALPLPTTIELKKSKKLVIFLGVMLTLALFISLGTGVIASIGALHTNPGSSLLPSILLVIASAAILALIVALALIFWLGHTQIISKIVVDEQGITSTCQGITSSIRWSDARLFALVSPDKLSALSSYELASPTTLVHWANMPARTLFGWRNNAASLEYDNKVQALLSVTAARTGLPLYDLDATLKAQEGA